MGHCATDGTNVLEERRPLRAQGAREGVADSSKKGGWELRVSKKKRRAGGLKEVDRTAGQKGYRQKNRLEKTQGIGRGGPPAGKKKKEKNNRHGSKQLKGAKRSPRPLGF